MNFNKFDNNVYKTLIASAYAWPDKLAIADEFGELTYAQLLTEVESLQRQLSVNSVMTNTGVALIAKNNRHFIIGLYAALGCQAIVMPLAHYLKAEEINRALIEANIHFILTDTTSHNESGVPLNSVGGLHLTSTQRDVCKPTVSFIDDVAVMRFTSGTTGEARCVILSHHTVLERIEAANEGLRLTENDRVLWVLPIAYHFVVSIMLYIRYGCGIIFCDDFLAENIITQARNYNGTFLYASPMHIKLLAGAKNSPELPALKRVISTTTAINPAVCKQFESVYHLPVSQAFGIIEVGLPIINLKQSSEHPEAVGTALPSFTVSVLSDDLKPIAYGNTGHLAIKGPGMFDGYLSPPTTRNEILKDDWFLTGDLASISPEGLIEIKGRTKNVINVSGNKVFPDEVEVVINQYAGIQISKVYGQKHPLLGEIVTADVVLTDKGNFDQEDLIDHCRKMLTSFKVPQRILVVDHIEMTASGKIKRV